MKNLISTFIVMSLLTGLTSAQAEDIISEFSEQRTVIHCPVEGCVEMTITIGAIALTTVIAKKMQEVKADALLYVADGSISPELKSVVDEMLVAVREQHKEADFDSMIEAILLSK